jgi:[amino group carrier protein]-L-2-aminoadipate/L-glutamate 6-kinase
MPYAQGRMRKKLLGAREALRGGVRRVCIGRDSLLGVLHGAGTTIGDVQAETMMEGAFASIQDTTRERSYL